MYSETLNLTNCSCNFHWSTLYINAVERHNTYSYLYTDVGIYGICSKSYFLWLWMEGKKLSKFFRKKTKPDIVFQRYFVLWGKILKGFFFVLKSILSNLLFTTVPNILYIYRLLPWNNVDIPLKTIGPSLHIIHNSIYSGRRQIAVYHIYCIFKIILTHHKVRF